MSKASLKEHSKCTTFQHYRTLQNERIIYECTFKWRSEPTKYRPNGRAERCRYLVVGDKGNFFHLGEGVYSKMPVV